MDLGSVRFLQSERGVEALRAARDLRAAPPHRRVEAMAGHGTREEVRAVLTQDDLRRRAAARCPHAETLLFEADALEQATAWPVAEERATRWQAGGEDTLTDLGAGIGFDALAAALYGRSVVAFEHDEVRAALLAHNATTLKIDARLKIRSEDVLAAEPSGPEAFLDPDRRAAGRRTRDPRVFLPPHETWDPLLARFERAMVKLPPMARSPGVPDAPAEFVSLGGRARERRWFAGSWSGLAARRALALPSGKHVEGEGIPWPQAREVKAGDLLLDPDVSVTLAGLVGDLAVREGLSPAHPEIPYLVGDEPRPACPGHWMHVADVLPPRPKELNAWLVAGGVGNLTIRKRGVEEKAERWRGKLRPKGSNAGTLVFTRDLQDRWVVYGCTEEC